MPHDRLTRSTTLLTGYKSMSLREMSLTQVFPILLLSPFHLLRMHHTHPSIRTNALVYVSFRKRPVL